MPFIDTFRGKLHYELNGPAEAPVLVLSNALGTTLDLWLPQVHAFGEHFRVLRYDMRGHGLSDVTPGPYSMAQLGADVLALLDHLRVERAYFCGISMGGMIGIWLGVHAPQRIARLALCNTSPAIGVPEVWNARIAKVRHEGVQAIAEEVLGRWFTPDFLAHAPAQVERIRAMLRSAPAEGYAAACAAVRDMNQRGDLHRILLPTLVVTGKHDKSTPPEHGELIARAISGARLVELNAAHLSNWEVAQGFTQQVLDFMLGKVP